MFWEGEKSMELSKSIKFSLIETVRALFAATVVTVLIDPLISPTTSIIKLHLDMW